MFTTLAMWWRDLRRAVCGLAPASRQQSSSDGARSGKVVAEHIRNERQRCRYCSPRVGPGAHISGTRCQ